MPSSQLAEGVKTASPADMCALRIGLTRHAPAALRGVRGSAMGTWRWLLLSSASSGMLRIYREEVGSLIMHST
jgi:hypothetical protein